MAIKEDIDSSLVTAGIPAAGGCCYVAFGENPTLPTDATTKMSEQAGFESLGELSENGFTEGISRSVTKHQGWHGSTLLTTVQGEENTFKVEFLEVNRPSVAKIRYGKDNVTAGTDGSVSAIKVKTGAAVEVALVFDEEESNGFLRRTVVKRAAIDTIDDTPHARGGLLAYGMTFTALDTGDGEPVAIYRAKPVIA